MTELMDAAREARASAYAPYSEYPVGAALETADGTVFTGCNIETANYSNSLHAEEGALASAIDAGHTEFERLAVSSAAEDGLTPCGMCRQTLVEFCGEEFPICCDAGGDGIREFTLGALLPEAIDRELLGV